MTVAATDSQIEQDQNCRVQRQQHFDPNWSGLKDILSYLILNEQLDTLNGCSGSLRDGSGNTAHYGHSKWMNP